MQITFLLIFIFLPSFIQPSALVPLPAEMEKNILIYLNFCREGRLINPEKISSVPHPKLSIVIPMYNEEENAEMIIRSIQNQSLKEIEIVCVNDHSTDNTLKILKSLQKSDERITIINNKKNRGVMYNRIYGGLQSKGEYVTFADADDSYCNPEIFKRAYETAKSKHVDMVHFHSVGGNYDKRFTNNTYGHYGNIFLFAVYNPNIFEKVIRQPMIAQNYFTGYNNITGSALVFDKIYSRRLVERMADYLGEDLWNQNLIYMDDALFTFAAMKCTESFVTIDQIAYWHWLGNDISTTSYAFEYKGYKLVNPKKTNKKLGDYMIVMEKILDLTEEEPYELKAREYYIRGLGEDKYLHGFARTIHFDKYMSLIERLINWKYIDYDTKKRMKEFARFVMGYNVDLKLKYKEILDVNGEKSKENKGDL